MATIANDLVTCGALPISVAMHAAVGDSAWFADERRAADLVGRLRRGLPRRRGGLGRGETPALRGLVAPGAIVLAGSAIGRIAPKSLRIMGDVRAGDAIVFLASSGVQTNGLTLCRQLADRLPEGYATRLEDGTTFGEALLAPSAIYVGFVGECQRRGLKLNYLAHVTGHGWRKLMRLEEPFVYEITDVRTPPPVFRFLMAAGPIEPREAYGTFNMGIGFAAFVGAEPAPAVVAAARQAGLRGLDRRPGAQGRPAQGGRGAPARPGLRGRHPAGALNRPVRV